MNHSEGDNRFLKARFVTLGFWDRNLEAQRALVCGNCEFRAETLICPYRTLVVGGKVSCTVDERQSMMLKLKLLTLNIGKPGYSSPHGIQRPVSLVIYEKGKCGFSVVNGFELTLLIESQCLLHLTSFQ